MERKLIHKPLETPVRFFIDGVRCVAEAHTTILEEAQTIGITLPSLCSEPFLEPYGACRLCVVEVEAEEKNGSVCADSSSAAQSSTTLVAACSTMPTEDMHIKTCSPAVMRARRITIGLLLLRAPKSERLLALANEYGSFSFESIATELGTSMQADDCILCGLCVKACARYGKESLQFIERGTKRRVGLLTPDLCTRCTRCYAVCPTQAIYHIVATQETGDKQGERRHTFQSTES